MFVLTVAAVAAAGCRHENPGAPGRGPSLAPEHGLTTPTGAAADNSRCHVCHINYEDEVLAVTHAQAHIGCERCHGASDAHCSDEDNVTPPDVMYPPARLNASCMKCHRRDTIDLKPHKPLFDGSAPLRKRHCTDCHGEHRLGYRTRNWDKATGELLEDDDPRTMTKGTLGEL